MSAGLGLDGVARLVAVALQRERHMGADVHPIEGEVGLSARLHEDSGIYRHGRITCVGNRHGRARTDNQLVEGARDGVARVSRPGVGGIVVIASFDAADHSELAGIGRMRVTRRRCGKRRRTCRRSDRQRGAGEGDSGHRGQGTSHGVH